METITIPRMQFEQMAQENQKLKVELEFLRNSRLYQRLLECLGNLKIKKYTRRDLGI